jgi:[ribosomal protein S18]-alanine N-acetyltransferase
LSGLLIEDMRPEDVPQVLAIEKASFTTPWSEILFMNEIYKAGSMPKVARLDGEVIGYICANQVLDEGHILNVTVHPEYRRQGVAAELLSRMTAFFCEKGCKVIFLEVRDSNSDAIRMYEKAGFRVMSRRKKYYTLPEEDAVNMEMRISGKDP